MLEAVVAGLPNAFREEPIACGMVLGSGWGDALPIEAVLARVPYTELEGFGASTVEGHSGEMLLVRIAGKRVLVFSGRRHLYEGCTTEQVVYPVEVMRRLGVPVIFLTNAAGGLRSEMRPGDLMVITDHLNLTGASPLRGAHRPEWGARFPDMTQVYDAELVTRFCALVTDEVHRGVYAFSMGPAYETPAEVRALRLLGGDAVGMSTVPEATVAHACGLRVLAVSCITNLAAGLSTTPLSHAEVLAATNAAKPRMSALIQAFVASL